MGHCTVTDCHSLRMLKKIFKITSLIPVAQTSRRKKTTNKQHFWRNQGTCCKPPSWAERVAGLRPRRRHGSCRPVAARPCSNIQLHVDAQNVNVFFWCSVGLMTPPSHQGHLLTSQSFASWERREPLAPPPPRRPSPERRSGNNIAKCAIYIHSIYIIFM